MQFLEQFLWGISFALLKSEKRKEQENSGDFRTSHLYLSKTQAAGV